MHQRINNVLIISRFVYLAASRLLVDISTVWRLTVGWIDAIIEAIRNMIRDTVIDLNRELIVVRVQI